MAGNMPEVVKNFWGAGRSQLGLEWVVSRLSGSFCSSWQKPDRTKLLFDPPSPTLSSVRAIENGLGFLQPDRSRPLQASERVKSSAQLDGKL